MGRPRSKVLGSVVVLALVAASCGRRQPPAATSPSATGPSATGPSAPSPSAPGPSAPGLTTTASTTSTPPAPAATQPCGWAATPPVTYTHVVWIWMENHTAGAALDPGAAPYTASLARACGVADHVRAVGSPSLPNYLGATSGSTWGIGDDAGPASHPLTADNLFRQVRATQRTARTYAEDMPGPCALRSGGGYAVKHNPAAYYVGGTDRAACNADDLPLGTSGEGALVHDLGADTLPAFALIVPNLCDDTHDCPVSTGDVWLRRWVPRLLASPAYRSGQMALFLTWDEPTPMALVVVTPSTPPGTTLTTAVDHYALLRTTEDLLDLPVHLGRAGSATSLRAPFHC